MGAGTGILSLFCMSAGAKRVYAVEASNLAITLKEVVKKNDTKNIIQVSVLVCIRYSKNEYSYLLYIETTSLHVSCIVVNPT